MVMVMDISGELGASIGFDGLVYQGEYDYPNTEIRENLVGSYKMGVKSGES